MTTESGSDAGLVRLELARILESETFAQSDSLRRFLQHVVEAKLNGREGELKELSLGGEVFGRGDSYDPRIDPIVRVQATRLRSKLRDYYEKEGSRAEIRIELPKGSYVPAFERLGRSDAPGPPSKKRTFSVLALLAGLAALALALIFFRAFSRGENGSGAPVLRSIAVLPFTDMSPGGDHQYYGDGLAEEITTSLGSVEGLTVVPRTSAFRFKDAGKGLKDFAAELGADAVLQGSLRRSEDRLRIQAQLIRSRDGRQVWSETYDRPASDAFEVQEEIARSVARVVEKKLASPAEGDDRHAPDSDAYERYLRGLFEREKNTPPSLERSIALFESAVEKDPDFAAAYAGLVQSHVGYLLWGLSPPAESKERAREASDRALALAGDDPQVLAAAAAYRLFYEWDFTRAQALLDRGLSQEGRDRAEIHLVQGILLATRGSLDEASREIGEAAKLQRHSPVAHHLEASVAFHRGNYDEALERSLSILKWAPDYPLAWLLLARVQDKRGRFAEAEEALASFEKSAHGSPVALAFRAVLFAHEKRDRESRELLRELSEIRDRRYMPPALLARVHAALGEVEAAMSELEKASSETSLPLLFLAIDPDYESLRSGPAFRALIQKLGLPSVS